MRNSLKARCLAAAVTGLALLAMVPGTANAAAKPGGQSAGSGRAATFKGKTIDLRKGWGKAQTCVVLGKSDVRCYATAAEADQVLGYSRATDPLVKQAKSTVVAAAIPACASNFLCLYQDRDGGGRRLIFQDDYWQDLSEYDFANQMSSWRNNQGNGDYGYVWDNISDLTLTLSYVAYSSYVGDYWNDHADWVQG